MIVAGTILERLRQGIHEYELRARLREREWREKENFTLMRECDSERREWRERQRERGKKREMTS